MITAETARQVNDALQALELVSSGTDSIDHLFADLVDREPVLPDFLVPDSTKTNRSD